MAGERRKEREIAILGIWEKRIGSGLERERESEVLGDVRSYQKKQV